MGEEFCKSCENNCQGFEEQNLTRVEKNVFTSNNSKLYYNNNNLQDSSNNQHFNKYSSQEIQTISNTVNVNIPPKYSENTKNDETEFIAKISVPRLLSNNNLRNANNNNNEKEEEKKEEEENENENKNENENENENESEKDKQENIEQSEKSENEEGKEEEKEEENVENNINVSKESEKVIIDENELNEIIYNYRINTIFGCFKRLKKLKNNAHNIIQKRTNLIEPHNLLIVEGDEDLDVDLFPEETYDYLGNIFFEKKDGFGIQYFNQSNSKYIGNFLNDKRINNCKFEDKSKGYTYTGETNLNFTGKYGIYINYNTGITYEGEWKNNRKEGYGVELYKDNSFYEGEFHYGSKQGIGKYYWSDGSVYEGQWVNNTLEGYGIYKFKDGSYCWGEWYENQINGFGKFYFPGIKCYIGFFEKDIKSGFGLIFWFNEKKVFVGYWKDNKQNGIGKFISNGNIRYGFWENGKKVRKYEEKDFFILINSEPQIYKDIFGFDYEGLHNFVQLYGEL